ncbi:TetR/AcrR family transcriptional regulator [Dietzia kunjamensis]|uniref:TetR/AcrR family transcriptional regulator n=1 Tax=Dietzia maris TaxID=37915 RepID=A0AAE4QU44_9ACTN|nr:MULTISPECIES: TetR/AcrR family transcriptional regulator [Dietzia]MCZ4656018.1 TetR/AcrR family transcriptional regulator [Dietzia kunjamensis]MDV6298150.1 TetR/AcrR family transcriptional regulator [Dietzia maris]
MRRVPKQARSRAMVERIVEAARVVLVRDGYESFTTNRVADEAEVSPGSLYQYFPDKSALVAVVMDRWSAEISDRVAASLSATGPVDVKSPATARSIADALLTALEADAGLLRIMWEELPAVRHRAAQHALEQRVRELLAVYLAAAGATSGDPAARAWVIVMAVENIAVRWVLDRPAISRDALLDELTSLAGGFGGRG